MNMEKNALVRQIEKAFDGVPIPKSANIVSHQCQECDAVARTFGGRNWKEWKNNPLAYLTSLNFDFRPLMTAEAQRYYLPLFMIGCIYDHKKADFFCDALIGSFIPPPTRMPPEALKTAKKLIRAGIPGVTDDQLAEIRLAMNAYLRPAPSHLRQSRKLYRAFIGGLSKQQLEAISSFLKFLLRERGDDSSATISRALKAIGALGRKR